MKNSGSVLKTSMRKWFWMFCLLVFLELTSVSGKVNRIRDIQNYNSEGQKIHTLSGKHVSVNLAEKAGLWSARCAGTVLGIRRERQKIASQAVSGSHAMVWGLSWYCFLAAVIGYFSGFFRKKIHFYTEHILSYRYCLAYL